MPDRDPSAIARTEASVPVEGGAVPVHLATPPNAAALPGLVVVPSIFGPAKDLLDTVAGLADAATTVVADPFWRVGAGPVSYDDHEGAIGRLRKGFDRDQCFAEMRAVMDWTRARCNGRVVGLGICFGGPVVLTAAAAGALDGIVAWHGSRMEQFLDGAEKIEGPVRLHFGEADPITPPEAIEKIERAFASHRDARFVVHPGAQHGFSHEGAAWDEKAAKAGVADLREVLVALGG
jgi:carboxymethylenebutenolidase